MILGRDMRVKRRGTEERSYQKVGILCKNVRSENRQDCDCKALTSQGIRSSHYIFSNLLYSEDLFFSKHHLTNPWHLTSPLGSSRFSQINFICMLCLHCALPLAEDGRGLNPRN